MICIGRTALEARDWKSPYQPLSQGREQEIGRKVKSDHGELHGRELVKEDRPKFRMDLYQTLRGGLMLAGHL